MKSGVRKMKVHKESRQVVMNWKDAHSSISNKQSPSLPICSVLRFASANIDTLNRLGRLRIIEKQLEHYNVDFAGLQETRWNGCGELNSQVYKVVFSGRNDGKHQEGVALLVKHKYAPALLCAEAVNERILAVRLKCKHNNMTIFVVYAPTNEAEETEKDKFYQSLQSAIEKVPKRDVVIFLGDFNARVGKERKGCEKVLGSFGYGERNGNGEKLLEFSAFNGLKVASTWFQHKDIHKVTWYHPDGVHRAAIDHILINQSLHAKVMDVRVYRGAEISASLEFQHRLLIGKICVKPILLRKPKPLRFNSNITSSSEECKEYARLIKEKYEEVTKGQVKSYKDEWENFKVNIQEAAKCFTKKDKKRSEWITEKTIKIVEAKRKVFKKMIKAEEKEKIILKEEYKRITHEVRSSCRKDKKEWWSKKAVEIENAAKLGDSRNVYQTLKFLRDANSKPMKSLKSRDGKSLHTPEEMKDRWVDHFSCVLNQKSNRCDEVKPEKEDGKDSDGNLSLYSLLLTRPPDEKEINAALLRMKNNKAPGEDMITAELLKVGGSEIVKWLERIFVIMWKSKTIPQEWADATLIPVYKRKGPQDECDSYRGISLLSVPGKLFTRVLLSRIQEALKGKISERQCLQSGRSTTDAIFTIRQLLEKARETNTPFYACFVDLKKSF